MHRFYCPTLAPLDPAGTGIGQLDPDQAHHARRVLRLTPGDVVELFDGKGITAQGKLVTWDCGATVALHAMTHAPAPRPWVTIASAVPKGGKAEDMVNQLSQAGADRWVPLLTSRSVVDPREGKLERFHKAAVESAKQCRRAHVMDVTAPMPLKTVLAEEHAVKLIAAPGGTTPARLAQRLRLADRVLALIGPEGGWTDEELQQALAAGCEAWSMGPHIMRIETAALAATALLRYLATPGE